MQLTMVFLTDHREFAFTFECSARLNQQHICFSAEPMPELLILRFHLCNPDFTLSGYFPMHDGFHPFLKLRGQLKINLWIYSVA